MPFAHPRSTSRATPSPSTARSSGKGGTGAPLLRVHSAHRPDMEARSSRSAPSGAVSSQGGARCSRAGTSRPFSLRASATPVPLAIRRAESTSPKRPPHPASSPQPAASPSSIRRAGRDAHSRPRPARASSSWSRKPGIRGPCRMTAIPRRSAPLRPGMQRPRSTRPSPPRRAASAMASAAARIEARPWASSIAPIRRCPCRRSSSCAARGTGRKPSRRCRGRSTGSPTASSQPPRPNPRRQARIAVAPPSTPRSWGQSVPASTEGRVATPAEKSTRTRNPRGQARSPGR